MTTIINWPANLVPARISVRPPRETKSLTRSLTNFRQVRPVIRAPFGMTMEFSTLEGGMVLAYRALLAALHGRANLVRVPVMDVYGPSDADLFASAVAHSDGSPFSDGSLYSMPDLSGVLASGAQGDTSMTVDFGGYGAILQAGQYFGLGESPYIVTSVGWAGAAATIGFSPALRRSYVNEPMRLRPTMIGCLTGDDVGEHMLDLGRWTQPTLDFDEAFAEALG